MDVSYSDMNNSIVHIDNTKSDNDGTTNGPREHSSQYFCAITG